MKQSWMRLDEKQSLKADMLQFGQRHKMWKQNLKRINCFVYDAIEGQMKEVKGVGRRLTQPLDGSRNRRRYRKLKEKAEQGEKYIYRTNVRKKYKLSHICS